MKKIISITLLFSLTFSLSDAKSYAEYMAELKGVKPTQTKKTKSSFDFFSSPKKKKSVSTPPRSTSIECKFDKQIKEVKQEVKEVKQEVKRMNKAMASSNKDLIKEVKEVKKAVVLSSKHQGKGVIPVAMINETTPTTRNSFLTIGFGFQGLSVTDDNGFFSENALDDSAIDIKAGYGQYFDAGDTKLFATGGFEYLSLKQADMKAITASINTQSNLGKDITGHIGVKAGYSYLVWDIPQDEAIQSITSSSPLVGVQAGIEYKFTDTVSLVLGADYTKYFHQTEIPNDVLNTSSAYGINISLKFYQ